MPSVRFRLNGLETSVDDDPDRSLLDILRGQLGITGVHFGCGANECGACNVMIGDHAVASCDTPLWAVEDKDVTTVEGLGTGERPHPLQAAFIAAFRTRFSLGALVSFLVTVADVPILNIGAAFWGLIAGLLVSYLLERPDFAPADADVD